MKFSTMHGDFHVVFSFDRDRRNPLTSCRISKDGKCLAIGQVSLDSRDRFSRWEGRIRAFRKATESFPRHWRVELNKAYKAKGMRMF